MKQLVVAAGVLSVAGMAHGAHVANQYTFNDGTANDSVGSANGTLQGTATVSGGALILTGGGAGNSYVDLGAGVASAASNAGTAGQVAVGTWVTVNNNADWAVIFSFGNSGPGAMDNNGSDGDYWQLIPQNGIGGDNDLRTTTHEGTINAEVSVDWDGNGPLATGTQVYIVDQLDLGAGTHDLYVNGVLVGSGGIQAGFDPGTYGAVGDTQNWLGRSQWGDPSLDGSIDEFTIYNRVLTQQEITDNFNAGPIPVPEPGSLALLGLGGLALVRRRR